MMYQVWNLSHNSEKGQDMIIDIRGGSGAGKSTLVRNFLDMFSWTYDHDRTCYYIPERHTCVIGVYHRPDGTPRYEGQLDHLSIPQLESLVRQNAKTHDNVIFECGRVSNAFLRWDILAEEVGFHNYGVIWLDRTQEELVAGRRERAAQAGHNMDPSDEFLAMTRERTGRAVRAMLAAGRQVYRVDTHNMAARILEKLTVDFNDNDEWFLDTAHYVSGGGKRCGSRLGRDIPLYTTIPVYPVDSLAGVRDSVKRINDFGITDDMLNGTRWLEFGSNAGGLSFALARRGAKVFGYEYNPERVAFCNLLARYTGYDARFATMDLNADDLIQLNNPVPYVLCCSVDEYIHDRRRMYRYLASCLTDDGVLFFESDAQDQSRYETQSMLEESFSSVTYLGRGDGGTHTRRRYMFRCER